MNNAGGQTDGRAGERAGGQVGEPVGGEGAGRCENTGASLLRCAQLLVADSNLMPDMLGEASQDAFDSAVRAKGERILASGRQNVTSLQARAGMMDERGARTYWRGLVRSDTERSVSGRATGHAVPCLGGTVHHGRCE